MFARPKIDKQAEHKSFLSYGIAGKELPESVLEGLQIPASLMCEFCEGQLSNPVKLDCEHVFCEECALIMFRRDKEGFERKMGRMRATATQSGEAVGKDLRIQEDRDVDEKFVGTVLRRDEKEGDEKKLSARRASVQRGECINCKFRLNGIFNKVDRLLNFLQKAKVQKAKMTELKKRSKKEFEE